MQFHLNGVRPAAPPAATRDPTNVDVLIVGSGPAGLMLAASLSRFPDLNTRLIDQRHAKLDVGQADGVQCRSVEIFQAFGFADEVLREAYWVNEVTFWSPDKKGGITRTGRTRDVEEGLSEMPHVILSQARIHDHLLSVMSQNGMEPSYSRRMKGLSISENAAEDYPVSVTLERTEDGHEAEVEEVRAKYVVGCDGARSAVRNSLSLPLHGDSANQAWGVMDVLAVTDFPDARLKSAIHSADAGSILIIPREGGYLTRFYIELEKLKDGERVSAKNLTAEHLISAARRILAPYTLDVREVAWWSAYEIGQRLTKQFCDPTEHVFIAGDACHTHSPKAGQGMNVSMNDGFNLGWKLASVLLGRSHPSLLSTYTQERQGVAQQLIDFDREFAAMFSKKPSKEPGDGGIDPAEFEKFFVQAGRFTAGTGIKYGPSKLTIDASAEDGKAPRCRQELAEGYPVGMRFHSQQIVRLADAKPVQLGHTLVFDGRWRLVIFGGDVRDNAQWSRFEKLCEYLRTSSSSPVRRYTPAGADVDSVIETLAVLATPRTEIEMDRLPGLLWPRKGKYGLRDYEKVFTDVPSYNFGHGRIYETRNISSSGCVVAVRPDQYVSLVTALDDHESLEIFFESVMREPEPVPSVNGSA